MSLFCHEKSKESLGKIKRNKSKCGMEIGVSSD